MKKTSSMNTKNVSIFFQVQGRGLTQCFSSDLYLNLITIHAPTKRVQEDKLHNERIKNHSHLLVLDVLLLKPMQDLLLQPATKEETLSGVTLKTAHWLHTSFLCLPAK